MKPTWLSLASIEWCRRLYFWIGQVSNSSHHRGSALGFDQAERLEPSSELRNTCMGAQKPNYFVDRKHLILRIRIFLVRMHQKELILGSPRFPTFGDQEVEEAAAR